MVKNTHGGNKHKSQARKFVVAKPNNKLRISEEEGELYAVVTKMLGNGMFHAQCIDGITRLGFIRGKFSGRKKRDNIVAPGIWVLVGEREWDISDKKDEKSSKIKKCDLLEVYSDADVIRLKDTISENWNALIINDGSSSKKENSDIYFATENDEEIEQFISEMQSNTTRKIVFDEDPDEIDVNDI
jgi:initiation factor 1A